MNSPITPELYRHLLARLCDAIGDREYFSGSIVFQEEETEYRLIVSVIVYRRKVQAPEGVSYPVCDLIPVWWELHTLVAGEEQINDFSFSEMRACLL